LQFVQAFWDTWAGAFRFRPFPTDTLDSATPDCRVFSRVGGGVVSSLMSWEDDGRIGRNEDMTTDARNYFVLSGRTRLRPT